MVPSSLARGGEQEQREREEEEEEREEEEEKEEEEREETPLPSRQLSSVALFFRQSSPASTTSPQTPAPQPLPWCTLCCRRWRGRRKRYAVLLYTILYYTILYYTILYYTIL